MWASRGILYLKTLPAGPGVDTDKDVMCPLPQFTPSPCQNPVGLTPATTPGLLATWVQFINAIQDPELALKAPKGMGETPVCAWRGGGGGLRLLFSRDLARWSSLQWQSRYSDNSQEPPR